MANVLRFAGNGGHIDFWANLNGSAIVLTARGKSNFLGILNSFRFPEPNN